MNHEPIPKPRMNANLEEKEELWNTNYTNYTKEHKAKNEKKRNIVNHGFTLIDTDLEEEKEFWDHELHECEFLSVIPVKARMTINGAPSHMVSRDREPIHMARHSRNQQHPLGAMNRAPTESLDSWINRGRTGFLDS